MPFRDLSALQREMAIRLQLRGRRLAFEIGLDEDWYESAALTFTRIQDGRLEFDADTMRRHPATLVVLLAAAGALFYREGALWDKLGVSGPKAARVGESFRSALRSLGLETFESMVDEQNALRNLTPILAHGGVPHFCLSDYFRLLIRTIRHGCIEPPEILSLWRSRSAYTQGVDKPAIRFVLHGGEPAVDFLQRCVDLVLETRRTSQVPEASDVGLPDSLLEAFKAFESEVRSTVARDSFPRPGVQLDPWDGLGPTLDLPPCESQAGTFYWQFRDDRRAVSYHGSRIRSQTLRLNPARSWEVEARIEGRESRTFVFECFGSLPALFFDPFSSRLWRSRDQLRLNSVWALHESQVQLTCVDTGGQERAPIVVEELPQPAGSWAHCRLAHYDLTNVRVLVINTPGGQTYRVAVAVPGVKPELAAVSAVTGARSGQVPSIYPDFPVLRLPEIPEVPWDRWRVTARSHGETRNATAAQLERTGSLFGLKSLLGDWMLREVEISVRGPLGRDLNTAFAIVPGLKAELPNHVLMPQETSHVRLTAAPPTRLGVLGNDGTTALHVGPTADQVNCRVVSAAQELVLHVRVPRLKWALAKGDELAVFLGNEPLVLVAAEILDSAGIWLVVGTGEPRTRLRLRLVGGGHTLQASEWVETSTSGRSFFDLARFRDTIAHGEQANAEFVLDCGNLTISVARVSTRLEVCNITATRTVTNGVVTLNCHFKGGTASRNREVRFWSLDRPWEAPTTFQVPDLSEGFVAEGMATVPVPGRYVVEVSLTDPWNHAVRPVLYDDNCESVTLGLPSETEAYRAGLNRDEPLCILELAISTGRIVRTLSWAEASAVAAEAVAAACCQLANFGPPALNSRSLGYLMGLVAPDSRTLCSSVAAALDRFRIRKADILLFSIASMSAVSEPVTSSRNSEGSGSQCNDIADSVLRDVWTSCPQIAALVDVPEAYNGREDAISRCEEFLGIGLGDRPAVGQPIGAQEWGLPAHTLREIHRAMELKPARILDLDALSEGLFEWLHAEKNESPISEELSEEYRDLLDPLPAYTDEMKSQLDARQPLGTVSRGMALPQVTLAAALHVLMATAVIERAVLALCEVAGFAPRLVMRDLALSVVLVSEYRREMALGNVNMAKVERLGAKVGRAVQAAKTDAESTGRDGEDS